MMTPLTGDELVILIKARDLLYDKLMKDRRSAALGRAHSAVLDVLHYSYVEVPDEG